MVVEVDFCTVNRFPSPFIWARHHLYGPDTIYMGLILKDHFQGGGMVRWPKKLISARIIGFRHHLYGPDTIYMGLILKDHFQGRGMVRWPEKLISARKIGFRHHLYGPVTIYMGPTPFIWA